MTDLLWSDPLEEDSGHGLDAAELAEWHAVEFVHPNPTRGVGHVFGFAATQRFLQDNGLVAIIRAHETAKQGYVENYMNQPRSSRALPYVITLFSAPNYCGCYDNLGATLTCAPSRSLPRAH